MKISENTNIGLPIKNLLGLIFFICTGLYAFFTIQERLNKLETADTLFQADLLKKAEQEPKNLNVYAYRTPCWSNRKYRKRNRSIKI